MKNPEGFYLLNRPGVEAAAMTGQPTIDPQNPALGDGQVFAAAESILRREVFFDGTPFQPTGLFRVDYWDDAEGEPVNYRTEYQVLAITAFGWTEGVRIDAADMVAALREAGMPEPMAATWDTIPPEVVASVQSRNPLDELLRAFEGEDQ